MVECVCMWDYATKDADEICFKQKDVVILISQDKKEKEWYRAKHLTSQHVGLVPANYLKPKPLPFFQPNVSREGAIQLLMNKSNGAYLIRASESDQSQEVNLSLSVKYGEGVQHFKILMDTSYKFFLWVVKFKSLNEMVTYYETNSVSRSQHIMLLKSDGNQEICCAAFDFRGQESGELTFKKGDTIDILEKLDTDWWLGRIKGTNAQGLFPVSYVCNVTSQEQWDRENNVGAGAVNKFFMKSS